MVGKRQKDACSDQGAPAEALGCINHAVPPGLAAGMGMSEGALCKGSR